MTRGQSRVRSDDAQLLLSRERDLTLLIPAMSELALVLVDPLLGHVMGRVGGARREVHEERLVRHERLLLADPADSVVGQVFGEVVALLRGLRRLDRGEALVERGVPLVVLAADEAIEIFEPAAPGRPVVERAHRAGLPDRDLMTLSELRRGIAVQLEGLGQWRHRVRPQGRISGSRCRDLGDAAHAGRVMVATGQQCLSGRRAKRRGVEPRVLDRVGRDCIEVRRVAWTAERARCSEADIVDKDDQDVRGAFWRLDRLDRRELRVGVLGVVQDRPRHMPRPGSADWIVTARRVLAPWCFPSRRNCVVRHRRRREQRGRAPQT